MPISSLTALSSYNLLSATNFFDFTASHNERLSTMHNIGKLAPWVLDAQLIWPIESSENKDARKSALSIPSAKANVSPASVLPQCDALCSTIRQVPQGSITENKFQRIFFTKILTFQSNFFTVNFSNHFVSRTCWTVVAFIEDAKPHVWKTVSGLLCLATHKIWPTLDL